MDLYTFITPLLIIIIITVIFTVLSSWQSHSESSLGSCDEYRMAPGGRRPLDQANRLEPQARLYWQSLNRIHHHHLLSLLSPKADTYFTVPQRVEGLVDFGGCHMLTWFTVHTHGRRSPIQVLTGPSVD